MWELNNQTPFAAESTWGRDINGWHQWIVAVKGTYQLDAREEPTLAHEQLPPLLAAEYYGDPGQSSIKYDADLLPPKPTTDILVNGTAYAPQGKPTTEFGVAIDMPGSRKILRVLGERHWESGVTGSRPSPTRPVTQVPIRYEAAFGGWDKTDPNPARQKWDARNPVGRGIVSGDMTGKPLHQFEYPDGNFRQTGPAGFGAIDSHWSPRRELAGTYDKAWLDNRHPLLPLDWQPRSLQCAPSDQQTAKPLRGGESITLYNLTPAGKLQFALPRVYLAFTTDIDGRHEEHRAQLASVIIEPDDMRLIMVWTTVLLCRNEGDYLNSTTIRQKTYEQ